MSDLTKAGYFSFEAVRLILIIYVFSSLTKIDVRFPKVIGKESSCPKTIYPPSKDKLAAVKVNLSLAFGIVIESESFTL